MSATLRRSRFRDGAALLCAVVVTGTSASCTSLDKDVATTYCALMPDSVGLYVGNPVTQMGYRLGEVTAITAAQSHVRVDFSVHEQRDFPADVTAIIRSPSVLADRSLELVGNYAGGPQLTTSGCIPVERSFSPKSLSEVIGSADTFLNALSPEGSTDLADTVRGIDELARDNGDAAGRLVSRTSRLLDSPDQAVSDIGSIVKNVDHLTTELTKMRDPLKEMLMDGPTIMNHLADALDGTSRFAGPDGYGTIGPLTEMVSTLETRLGAETQLTLDSVSATVRKVSPYANAFAALFDPVPWWINSVARHYNDNPPNVFDIAYRPPLYRIPGHDGLALCGSMNTALPGSCADVHGQPYAVDVALLQYVLTEAARR